MEIFSLQTERVFIRKLSPGDLDDFYRYRSNPAVTKFQSFDVMNIKQAKEFIESQKDKIFGIPGEWTQYGIEDKLTQRLVGDCAIKLEASDTRIATIGITISHVEQRKGYAKETLAAIVDFLFSQAKVRRIVEIVDADNIASVSLLQSLGFKQEGHFIDNIFFKGKWGSEYQYALLKREWKR